MPPKFQQSSTLATPAKCRCSTHSTTSDTTQGQVTLPDASNIRKLSLSNLASLRAKMLRSQLKRLKLSSVGNKTTITNHLYQFLHLAVLLNTTPSTSVEATHYPLSCQHASADNGTVTLAFSVIQ